MFILRRCFFVACAIMFCHFCVAQNFLVRGGLTVANVAAEEENRTLRKFSKQHIGIHFGVSYDFLISSKLFVETGVDFTTKGVRLETTYFKAKTKTTYEGHYIEIPVLLKAYHEFYPDLKLFGLVGPFIGAGVGGFVNTSAQLDGVVESKMYPIAWGYDIENDEFKRFDPGIVIGGGIERNSLFLSARYNIGLTNVALDPEYDLSVKNRIVQVSIGYKF